MKTFLTLTILILFSTLLVGQNTTTKLDSTKQNPYSLKNDLLFEQKMIQAKRESLSNKLSWQSIYHDINSNDFNKKLQAVYYMGYLGGVDDIKTIGQILESSLDKSVKLACIQALNSIRSPACIPVLLKSLNDHDEEVRINSAINLTLCGEKNESFAFFKNYYDSSCTIPYYSCHIGFLYIANEYVRPYLVNDLNNPDIFIAIDAAIVLAQIGFGNNSFFFLKSSLNHQDKYVRMAALRGLAYIGDEESILCIQTLISDSEPLVSKRAKKITEKFKN